MALYTILTIIISYLLGSIPFGVLIGKIFFNKDVREYGSHNSGGTNTGRVLGKKVGLIVILLDAFKCMFAILINLLIYKLFFIDYGQDAYNFNSLLAGFCVAVGHCFPIFAKFKGGKAVATIAGFILSINWIVFLLSLCVFLITYFISKYVSLGSMLCSIFGTILCWIPFILQSSYFPGLGFGIEYSFAIPLFFTLTTALLVYRHRANIVRIFNGTESKSYLIKRKTSD